MIHWHNPDARNTCPAAADPGERMSMDARRVTCPRCKAAAATHARGHDETLRDAPAVRRREPTPAAGSPS